MIFYVTCLVAGSQIMSGETVRCMVDTTTISHIPASATVVLMPHSTQVTVMIDPQKYEGAPLRERGSVHVPLSVVHGRMITAVLPATVAWTTETDLPVHLIAVMEVAGLPIGLPTVTAKGLGRVTANDGATGHAHENTVTLRVEAAIAHILVKTAKTGRPEIGGHPLQTLGNHVRQSQMIHLSRILRKN